MADAGFGISLVIWTFSRIIEDQFPNMKTNEVNILFQYLN